VGTEAGKTSFGFWIEVAPGQSQSVFLTYILPNISDYSLLIQKQPGAPTSFLKVEALGKTLYQGDFGKDLLF